jgi:hypothetical protein
LDDYSASTASGNTIDIWGANGTGAQSWVFNNAGVIPGGATGTQHNKVGHVHGE